jgi:hypothetical protein
VTDTTIYFRGGRQLARQLASRLVGMVTGREPDTLGIGRGVFTAVGFAALSDIKADFIRKAKGQPGEDGQTWAPLSPKTIARRRIGPGDKRIPHIAARLQAEKDAAKAARQKFDADTKRRRDRLAARFALSMPPSEARKRADEQIKAERKEADFRLRGQIALANATGKRRWEILAQRQVDILRDTGVLLNSLSPGQISGDGPGIVYQPPGGDGGDKQVFSLFDSGVIVGTTVKYAKTHQEGDASRKIPARPFLPTRGVPQVWLDRWADAGQVALAEGARQLYQTVGT